MEFPSNIFRWTTNPGRWIIAVAVLALLLLTLYIAAFFYGVNSTLSDDSWGDISYYNQLAYNFTHGRPLQTSIYRQSGSGILHNPFPYAHSFSAHVNFTPYLFLWLYKFMPTVNGLYLITILFNVAGFLGIGWLIMRRICSSKDRFLSYMLVCVAFFSVLPFAGFITYKAHFSLFAGPLILAAYYFFLRGNRLMLAITGLLVCGVTEDLIMFMVSFSAYLFIFEKRIRKTALWMGLGSAAYLLFVVFVIHPAARYGLITQHISDPINKLHMLLSGKLPLSGYKVYGPFVIGFVLALTVMALFSNFRREIEWKKFVGLIFIAPASHWFIVVTLAGGHHFMPIMVCTFLAFLLIASRLEFRPVAVVRIAAAVIICMTLFLPRDTYRLLKRLHSHADAKSIARMETNKSTLTQIAALPKEAGISYWTNQGLDAFMTSRNNVWRFPDYFDSTDYLVIQKDADQTFFDTKIEASESIDAAIKRGQLYSSGTQIALPAEMVKRIENELVNVKASHEVNVDTEHVLILKRKENAGLPCPESTLGWGWIKHIKF